MNLRAIKADITSLEIDAIVNAANTSLLGGSGVDGAIHRAAGPEMLAECRQLRGCRTGEANATGGGRLRVRNVIHTVGPVWNGGESGEAALLASCYRNSLNIAAGLGVKTVAFPCISTGIYRFPPVLAAETALAACRRFAAETGWKGDLIFCCFSDADFRIYEALLAQQSGPPGSG